jgi:hypothetical protein
MAQQIHWRVRSRRRAGHFIACRALDATCCHRAQFKAGKPFETPLPIHRQSCYLFGRERRVADVPTDHPSCSKQQAVIQFR